MRRTERKRCKIIPSCNHTDVLKCNSMPKGTQCLPLTWPIAFNLASGSTINHLGGGRGPDFQEQHFFSGKLLIKLIFQRNTDQFFLITDKEPDKTDKNSDDTTRLAVVYIFKIITAIPIFMISSMFLAVSICTISLAIPAIMIFTIFRIIPIFKSESVALYLLMKCQSVAVHQG